MTGLDLSNVHLRTSDGGNTWSEVGSDHFESCMNGCTCEPETALVDGAILRAVWGFYLPYGDVPQTGFLQRSTDGARTWGEPQIILDPSRYSYWPKRIRVLRDGRVIITGAVADAPAASMTRSQYSRLLRPVLLASEDGGKTWLEPVEVLRQEHQRFPSPGEEHDAAELPNGDLLLVFRWAVYDSTTERPVREERRQSVLRRDGRTWKPGPVRAAPFPHSGHPELLATREGVVLHLASTGISWTADCGQHWHDADVGGTGYYPRARMAGGRKRDGREAGPLSETDR